MTHTNETDAAPAAPVNDAPAGRHLRVALLGNPNTGKTTLFNRLCGLRHKTANFPGTTQEARIGHVSAESADLALIDLPGVYSLDLKQSEAEICRAMIDGEISPKGEQQGRPDAVCLVINALHLGRGLELAASAIRRGALVVLALNMSDLAERRGLRFDLDALEKRTGCRAVLCNARTGEGLDSLRHALAHASRAEAPIPSTAEESQRWADEVSRAVLHASVSETAATLTDRLDRALTHPVLGVACFALVMTGLFWFIFRFATIPMDLIDAIFAHLGGFVESTLPDGLIQSLLSEGVVAGVGATVIFLPQIALLFFLISLLEDTGYLARAAFVTDRLLRPFGLPGHAFVPLLSAHACALPAMMAARGIPDRRERIATVLVAPFMTCSARLPVYVLMTTLLFGDRPALAALAFAGCYILGALAGLFSALLVRRTILPGRSAAMVLELPTFKLPSVRNALITSYDRSLTFLKKAGTVILAICIVLWWLGSFPASAPPDEAVAMYAQAEQIEQSSIAIETDPSPEDLRAEADRLTNTNATLNSYVGRLGRVVEPVFVPLGFDWEALRRHALELCGPGGLRLDDGRACRRR